MSIVKYKKYSSVLIYVYINDLNKIYYHYNNAIHAEDILAWKIGPRLLESSYQLSG